MRKVHITGVPGSGKTTLSLRLADRLGVPAYDLDDVGYDGGGAAVNLITALDEVGRIGALPGWVTEGSFVDWTAGLLAAADTIVWLDPPRRVVLWRIARRHVVATLHGGNKHPGVRKLLRFLRFVNARYDQSRGEKALALRPYDGKVHHVTTSDIDGLVERVVAGRGA